MLERFSKITFFGDSLTDDGNYFEIVYGHEPDGELGGAETGDQFGLGPYGALTNEYTHSTYLEQLTGVETYNYAVVGANVIGSTVINPANFGLPGTATDIALSAQVERFTADPSTAAGPGSAAVFFIGGNDLSIILEKNYPVDGKTVEDYQAAVVAGLEVMAETMVENIRTVHDAGIEVSYLGTIPSAAFFPLLDYLSQPVRDAFDDLLDLFNATLRGLAAGLRDEGLAVRLIDYAAISAALTDDPTSFGVIGFRYDFLIDGSPGYADSQIAFWNGLHPAEAYQKVWAAFTAFTLDGGLTRMLDESANFYRGGESDGLVLGLAGQDVILMGGGDDVSFGGTGNDAMRGEEGNDILSGGQGNDLIRGQSGDDFLSGGRGNDILTGGQGQDVLFDGLGDDIMRGGADNDIFLFAQPPLIGGWENETDYVAGGTGYDVLYLFLGTSNAKAVNSGELTAADFGITLVSIEEVIAIDGENPDAAEIALGNFDWYANLDAWGQL